MFLCIKEEFPMFMTQSIIILLSVIIIARLCGINNSAKGHAL